jgi:hypothetical protein
MTPRETRLRTRIDQLTDERDYYKDRFERAQQRRRYYRELARDRGEAALKWRQRYFDLRRGNGLRVA